MNSEKFHKDIMKEAIVVAKSNSNMGVGGPFGAAVVKDGQIICVVSNTVLRDNDPTAHAEINAIREACRILGTHDLSGCELYTTCEPCPMCLSAIIWANIKTVYYGCTAQDAENVGFRDDFIYNFIENGCKDRDVLMLEPQGRLECIDLFNQYTLSQGEIY